MRLNTHLDYIKNFNYLKFYKKKSCEYFKPISNIILGNTNDQIECAILNKEVINRIKDSLPKSNYRDINTTVSCMNNSFDTNAISVLSSNVLLQIKRIS